MARSEQFKAAVALPALLPTPPRSKMVPLLPTPCLIILPASFASQSKPKPGRADSVERWDAHKPGACGVKTPPPTERRAADRGGSLCRADTCDRWDSNKTTSPSRSSTSSSSSSPSRSRSRSSSRSPAPSSSSRESSSERWDIHKKPRLQAGALNGQKRSNAVMTTIPTTARGEFAGPSFASPEPSMLPWPISS